jgi:hypothetical protein
MKRFLKYAFRWQLSTPVLALCIVVIPGGALWQTLIANAVGAAIFYHVDKKIFKHKTHPANRSSSQEVIPYRIATTLKNKIRFWS